MADAHFQETAISTCKLLLSPVEHQMSKKIIHHFKQYGQIKTIDFNSNEKCAIVEFKHASSAKAAMEKSVQTINDKLIIVKSVHDEKQPTIDPLPIAPDNESPLHILNKLNDDCFGEIFEYFSLADLCNVAEVCQKFKAIAGTTFTKNYSSFKFEMLNSEIDTSFNCSDGENCGFECFECRKEEKLIERGTLSGIPLVKIEQVFHVFGTLMKQIDIDQKECGQIHNNRMLQFLADYCSGKKVALSNLTLRNFTIKGQLIKSLRPAFVHIKELHLDGGSYNSKIVQLLSASVDLKKVLFRSANITEALAQKLPKLEIIKLINANDMNDGLFERIVQTNPQIKQLMIFDRSIKFSSNIFRYIGMFVTNLERLIINASIEPGKADEKNMKHFLKLNHLKCLQLNCSKMLVEKLLMSLVNSAASMDFLHLSNFTFDFKIAECIAKFTNLNGLFLSKGIAKINLHQAIEMMPHLKYIHLYEFGQLNIKEIKMIIKSAKELEVLALLDQNDIIILEDDFKEMLASIQAYRNDTKVQLVIFGKNCKLIVSNELIKLNAHLLCVTVNDHDSSGGQNNSHSQNNDDETIPDNEAIDSLTYHLHRMLFGIL